MKLVVAVAVLAVGCKREPCPNGGDVRAQCLVRTDVHARVAATAAARQAFESDIATWLQDQPFDCGATRSDLFDHPSIVKVKTELAQRAKTGGIDGADVSIACPGGHYIAIAEAGVSTGAFLGVTEKLLGTQIDYGGFGNAKPYVKGVMITTVRPLPRHAVRIQTVFEMR